MNTPPAPPFDEPANDASFADIVCLSHLRWNFVFQRPQHLMTRFAARHRVFFVEEPVFSDGPALLELRTADSDVVVAVPHLPSSVEREPETVAFLQRRLLDDLLARGRVRDFVLWYYTPMALRFSAHLAPRAVVYDCMDELSGFAGAPPELRAREAQLLARAHLVTTGGRSLYEAKQTQHPNVHCFPSSVDAAHFQQARATTPDPEDQAFIPHPRIGYAGVIDERMDLGLLAEVAESRPDWSFIMLGPVVKIPADTLPVTRNIHYLGMKNYRELPQYLAGWDVAMLPFAHNDATRFISPTKTPEYLAAGRPVVSTSIRDVVRPYGDVGLARIADTPADFIAAIEGALTTDRDELMRRADAFLQAGSWDTTAAAILHRIDEAVAETAAPSLGSAHRSSDG